MEAFQRDGLEAWERVIAVVVKPGVSLAMTSFWVSAAGGS